MSLQTSSRIYVAGHRGMVGSAIARLLRSKGFSNIIERTSSQLDLRDQTETNRFFKEEKPEFVFLAAAKVGGIVANNTYRAEFLFDNLMMESNIINASKKYNVQKLLFLGSSCIYPKMAPQPIKEEYLLSGYLEQTNEPYAIAKIAGIKLCQAYHSQYGSNFISVMPTNLYGLRDNYHPENSHVLPALIRRFHEAKEAGLSDVTIWGTGRPMREFLYADDLADACLFLMNNYNHPDPVNVGTGQDITISELADLIKKIVGFKGTISFDHSKPDGTPRKLLDTSKINNLGWTYKTSLADGISKAYADFLSTHNVREEAII